MHFSAFPGIETQEYRAILNKMNTLIETLKVTLGATHSLTMKFQERDWLSPTTNVTEVTEENLISCVLVRIEKDTSSFYEFLTMLRSIVGMDQVVALLEDQEGD